MRQHPYILEKPILIGRRPGWARVAELWATAWPKRSKWRAPDGSEEEQVTHEVRLRFRSDLAPGMRLRRGARHLLIHHVEDVDGRGRYQLCQCEERVPFVQPQPEEEAAGEQAGAPAGDQT